MQESTRSRWASTRPSIWHNHPLISVPVDFEIQSRSIDVGEVALKNVFFRVNVSNFVVHIVTIIKRALSTIRHKTCRPTFCCDHPYLLYTFILTYVIHSTLAHSSFPYIRFQFLCVEHRLSLSLTRIDLYVQIRLASCKN